MSTNEPPVYPGEPSPTSGQPASPPPGTYPPPAAGSGHAGTPQGNTKALWSMIVGISSLVTGLFCNLLVIGSIVAIVLGFIARGEINRSQGAESGAGQAVTGIVTGFVLIALCALVVVLYAVGVIEYDFNVK